VDALIDAYRDRSDEAARKAEVAVRATPWLFEARLLAGDLDFREAVGQFDRGDVDAAAARADAADRAYAEAERVAGSSVDAYVGRCAVAGLLLHMLTHRLARDGTAIARQAEESCSRALLVDPGHGEAHRYYAEALVARGNIAVQDHTDPGDAYDRAASLAADAVRLSPGDIEARLALAGVFMNRAWWQSRSGQDPRAEIDRALAAYTNALAADPRNMSAADNFAQTLILRYRFEARQGLDPSASQARAIAAFERTIRIDPSYASPFRSIAKVTLEHADQQERRGLDPAPGLARVARFIEGLPSNGLPPTATAALQQVRARLDLARPAPAREALKPR
jgi:serine/threonine-protein kinase